MTRDTGAIGISPHFPLPSINEQANLAEKHGIETLLFCPDSWALRHVFINQNTGEVVRARCNRWDCLYCGPRKVDQWRQLVKGADFIPHEVLKEAWRSARHGVAYIVHVEAIRKPHVIGYVTRYLTRSLSLGEKGVRQEEREATVIGLDEKGKIVEERKTAGEPVLQS